MRFKSLHLVMKGRPERKDLTCSMAVRYLFQLYKVKAHESKKELGEEKIKGEVFLVCFLKSVQIVCIQFKRDMITGRKAILNYLVC